MFKGGLNELDERHGHGTYVWQTGDKFTGQWVNGYMHGKGTFMWADGDIFEGQWENGEMHGYGVKHMADGSTSLNHVV
jgi:1-phosphatidylinositol-4-phosphate 5-kinase